MSALNQRDGMDTLDHCTTAKLDALAIEMYFYIFYSVESLSSWI
jgi:hypothetical protein